MQLRYEAVMAEKFKSYANCKGTHSEVGSVTDTSMKLRAYYLGGVQIFVMWVDEP